MFKVWRPPRKEPVILSDGEKQEKIKKLREIIRDTDCELRTDDIYMTRWLHCRDWDVGAAFKRIMKFYYFKNENPDWYKTEHISVYEPLLKKNMAMILDGRDRKGRRVYLIRANRLDPDSLSIQEMGQVNNIWLESIADEPETIENGMAVLVDMKDISWKLWKWFTPANSKLSGRSTGLTPLKNFVIHIVNISPMCTALLGMVAPFFSASLRNRFCLHFNDMSLLHKCLGKEVLPEEYGGLKKMDYDKIYRNLYKMDDYSPQDIHFEREEDYITEKFEKIALKDNIYLDNQQIIAALD